MLGDDVVNKTVPLILCAEENVVGNHGATIGELDEDTLFYFESRGIGRGSGRRPPGPRVHRAAGPHAGRTKRRGSRSASEGWRRSCNMATITERIFRCFSRRMSPISTTPPRPSGPQCVLDAEAEFYTANANPLRGLYPLSVEATEIYENAREAVRDFLNAAQHARRSSLPATRPRG